MLYLQFFIIFSAVFSVISAATKSVEAQWHDYLVKYNKHYATQAEANRRFQTFKSNLAYIEQHNAEARAGRQLYTVKINEFADCTASEFFILINGADPNSNQTLGSLLTEPDTLILYRRSVDRQRPKPRAAASVDWRHIVTPVKDQGRIGCGSCYTFSATGAIEAMHAKKTGKLISLSEQNLMDCSKRYGNNGCEGGTMDAAFKYISSNRGINTEQIYPYEGITRNCRFIRNDPNLVQIKSYMQIRANDESHLESVLVSRGPVSAAIDASRRGLQFYNSGVYFDSQCKSDRRSLNHAILVVGCGVENGSEYWLVKNSWGTDWGDKGYFKLAKNKKNHCGIAGAASIPT